MSTSNHVRSPLARLALAAGGIAALLATAYVASVVDGLIGWPGGLLACGAVFAACWIVFRVRPLLRAARPAPVRLPEPAADLPEPARTAA